jgi:hypothetical protein
MKAEPELPDVPSEVLDEVELDPPVTPDLAAVPALDELLPDEPLPDELLPDDALVVPVPETVWPTSPDSDTIVPFSGAYRSVFCTAFSSLWTVRLSLLTAARAEARLASRVAALCWEVDALVLVGVVVALDSAVFVGSVEPDPEL